MRVAGIALIAMLLLAGCDSIDESQPYDEVSMRSTYSTTCAVCHGKDGLASQALAKPAIREIRMHAGQWSSNYSANKFVKFMKVEHEPPLVVPPDLLRYTKEHLSN